MLTWKDDDYPSFVFTAEEIEGGTRIVAKEEERIRLIMEFPDVTEEEAKTFCCVMDLEPLLIR
jgi:hypothetical protein